MTSLPATRPDLLQRQWLMLGPILGFAAVYGAMVAVKPSIAAGLVGAAIVLALAFAAPVTHLCLLLFLTVIVPYSINNRFGVGAGTGQAGLLGSDLFVFTGLARAVLLIPRVQLQSRQLVAMGLAVAFCVWVVIAAYTGISAGQAASDVGVELRTLVAFSAVLIAVTVLHDPASHARFARGLVVLGILLGLWGIAQWTIGFDFSSDFGVRAGVSYSTSGRGQVQGGLFAFPIAVIIAGAVLMAGHVERRRDRLWVMAVLALNTVSLLLTFERTFWVVAVLGTMIVLLRSGRARRLRSALWLTSATLIAAAAVSIVSPGTMQTARERLVSIGQYSSDNSLRYRRVESEHVIDKIDAKPLAGSGLGDAIWWGQPWLRVPPSEARYSHNGFLWLTWRLGLIGAALLLALFALAICSRGPPAGATPLTATIRIGAQASLLALLVSSITFPTFNGYGITAAMAVLIGVCALPRGEPGRSAQPAA